MNDLRLIGVCSNVAIKYELVALPEQKQGLNIDMDLVLG
jgi:hypothetical protein